MQDKTIVWFGFFKLNLIWLLMNKIWSNLFTTDIKEESLSWLNLLLLHNVFSYKTFLTIVDIFCFSNSRKWKVFFILYTLWLINKSTVPQQGHMTRVTDTPSKNCNPAPLNNILSPKNNEWASVCTGCQNIKDVVMPLLSTACLGPNTIWLAAAPSHKI